MATPVPPDPSRSGKYPPSTSSYRGARYIRRLAGGPAARIPSARRAAGKRSPRSAYIDVLAELLGEG